MNKAVKGGLHFLMGATAVFIIANTRNIDYGLADYELLPIFLVFYLLCGWLLSRHHRKIWPYPLLFVLPSIIILSIAFIINRVGFFHYIGETLMTIPGFLVGFYFFKWQVKTRIITAVLLPVFYFFYIFKINPRLDYYNKSIRIKSIQTIPGASLPAFQFIAPDSNSISLHDYKGKVVMIDFYFNRCGQCIRKMPYLAKIKDHYKDNPAFALLSVHRGGSETFSDFLSLLKKLPRGTYVYDSATIAEKYFNIEGYPLEILIDKQGKIRNQFAGYNSDVALVYEKATIKKIDALLNEK